MNSIKETLIYANDAHCMQSYGKYPYIYHLKKTLEVAQSFDYANDILTACILHDILEDTNINMKTLIVKYGFDVTKLVYLVTNKPGKNRLEKHNKTYPGIKNNWKAIAIKLCDRIANIEESIKTKSSLLKMYLKEHEYFVNALYVDDKRNEKAWIRYNNLIENENNIL